MRPYDRSGFRHLDDSERYRDIDYLGDDGFVGPNERMTHGMTRADLPPWSTLGDYETRPFAGQRAWDEDRGQGRQYGADLGPGYGRPYDELTIERTRMDPYERRADLPQDRPHPLRHAYDHRGNWHGRSYESERERGGVQGFLRDAADTLRHPGQLLDAAKGLFRGKGPKNWSRSDERIRDEVCERLAMNPEIDASDIEVTVKDGEVMLIGQIEDRRLRYLAEDLAEEVLGVHDVHNRLRLKGETRTTAGAGTTAGTQGDVFGSRTAERTASVGSNVSTTGGVRR